MAENLLDITRRAGRPQVPVFNLPPPGERPSDAALLSATRTPLQFMEPELKTSSPNRRSQIVQDVTGIIGDETRALQEAPQSLLRESPAANSFLSGATGAAAGALQNVSNFSALIAPPFRVLDNAATAVAKKFGLSDEEAFELTTRMGIMKPGAAEEIAERARRLGMDSQMLAEFGLEPDGWKAQAAILAGGLTVSLAEVAAYVGPLGPVAGFGAMSGFQGAGPEGDASDFAKAAAGGAALGLLFRITPGLSRKARFGILAPAGAIEAGLRGEDASGQALGGLTAGVFGALPRTLGAPTRKARLLQKKIDSAAAKDRAAASDAAAAQERIVVGRGATRAVQKRAAADSELVQVTQRDSSQAKQLVDDGWTQVEIPDIPDKVVNLNMTKYEGPDDLKRAIAKLVGLFEDDIQLARRGTVPVAETNRQAAEMLANKTGMTVEKLLQRQKGQALNASELKAATILHDASLAETLARVEAIRATPRGKVTPQMEAELYEFMALTRGVVSNTLGAVAETGRALNILRTLKRGGSIEQMRTLDVALSQVSGGKRDVHVLADMLHKIGQEAGGAPGQSKFARGAIEVSTGDKLLELWVNSLLSGPHTQAVNVLSNTLMAGMSVPEAYIAAGVGAARRTRGRVTVREANQRALAMVEVPAKLIGATVKGAASASDGAAGAARRGMLQKELTQGTRTRRATERELFLADMMPRIYSMWHGGLDAMKLMGMQLRSNVEFGLASQKMELAKWQAIDGTVGKFVRIPGTMLMGADDFFKMIGFRQELRARAMRQALKEQKIHSATGSGQVTKLSNRIEEILQNPGEELKNAAFANAEYQTFTRELAETGKRGQQFINSHPALRVVVPFVRTPTNIFKVSAERTPLAVISKPIRDSIKKGGPEGDTQLARLALGSMVMGGAALAAREGLITGSGPSNKEERAAWFAAGYQPYSFINPDTKASISFSRLEPFGTLLGVAADAADVMGHVGQEERDELAARIVMSFSRNVTNKTFLSGAVNFSQLVSDPDRYSQQVLNRTVSTVVPTGVAQINRSFSDPVLRDARTMIDAIKARIPGLSDEVRPRLNIWAQPIHLGGGWGPDIVSPLYHNRPVPDLSSQEVYELRLRLSPPRARQFGIRLSDEEHYQLLLMQGANAKRRIDQIVHAPGYFDPDVSDVVRAKRIQGAWDASIKQAKGEFRRDFLNTPGGRERLIQGRTLERDTLKRRAEFSELNLQRREELGALRDNP